MTTVVVPSCMSCRHYLRAVDGKGLTCAAFPGGVPGAIATAEVPHTRPFPGDHGIQFEPREEGRE